MQLNPDVAMPSSLCFLVDKHISAVSPVDFALFYVELWIGFAAQISS